MRYKIYIYIYVRSNLFLYIFRQNCFGTQYFNSCVQALLLEDEKEKLLEMVEYLGGKK